MTPREAIDFVGPNTIVEYIRRLQTDGKRDADYALVTALIFVGGNVQISKLREALAVLEITQKDICEEQNEN